MSLVLSLIALVIIFLSLWSICSHLNAQAEIQDKKRESLWVEYKREDDPVKAQRIRDQIRAEFDI